VHAIQVRSFGPPDVLEFRSLADPVPGPGEIVVATIASDVLFVDTMIRSGRGAAFFPIRPPYVPGNGVGGEVVALGEGIERTWLGRRVVAHTGGPAGGGGYAELATADIEYTLAVPPDVDLHDATAVLHDGTTALRILEICAVELGERTLVLGAAGGMGILLVQLLAARGAFVVGAARGPAKREVILEAGADAAVDYGSSDWGTAVLEMTDGEGPTLVLDGVGGSLGEAAFKLLADGGRFSAHGAPSGSFTPVDAAEASRRHITVYTMGDLQHGPGDRARLMAAVLRELSKGRITPLIGQTFSLADAAKAHLAMEARETIAKTLLLPDERPS
jgi:NADPH2:quinone reductase